MNGQLVNSRSECLSSHNVKELLDSVNAFLFDCDGVIWKGDKLIDGIPEALDMLRRRDEIFSSSFAAAMYLKVCNFPTDKKVYVIGEEGILEELELAGFTGLGGPADGKKTLELKSGFIFEHDKSVGLDQYINYYKLQYGTLCVRENPGCLFIATNRDAVGHMTDQQEWPGAGCMVGAMCGSTQKEPIVVGKPSTFMMDFLLQNSYCFADSILLPRGCVWLVTDWTQISYLERILAAKLSLFFQIRTSINAPKSQFSSSDETEQVD
ncbi:phosphoglycolate phosphatase 2-like isoform X2 [Ipomoea triloba]|uniref:phosphoglycolate phosphatase 2-like isoform X2 n=1 Tax=Ipomoea triloba TaxID=35885 RepID=UPI00125D5C8E|nr:phosphoglycolate phosphatase 2-like isoform X2 [Ipomoea triloba]